jgi:hypothetical protein
LLHLSNSLTARATSRRHGEIAESISCSKDLLQGVPGQAGNGRTLPTSPEAEEHNRRAAYALQRISHAYAARPQRHDAGPAGKERQVSSERRRQRKGGKGGGKGKK